MILAKVVSEEQFRPWLFQLTTPTSIIIHSILLENFVWIGVMLEYYSISQLIVVCFNFLNLPYFKQLKSVFDN